MITLESIAGKPLIINCEMIETIESTPDTKVTLVTGKYLIVRNSPAEIVQKVIEYHRAITDGSSIIRVVTGNQKDVMET